MTPLPDPPAIEGAEWRPATLADADAIGRLQAACAAVDDGWLEDASEIRERFESPMADAAVDSLLAVDANGDVIVSLWSLILPEPTSEWPVYDDNYIHPDHRTEAVRAFALDWWEARSLERIESLTDQDSGEPLPIRFHQHVYPAQTALIADISDRGYEPRIYFDELRRNLSQPLEAVSMPDGYELALIGDVAAVDVLSVRNDAFRDHRGSQQWTLEFWESRWSSMHRSDASFVVLHDSVPCAFVRSAVYPHDAELRGYSEGWIEQIGTARAHRGKGLASLLIHRAMEAFASSGIEYATLEVDTENPTGAHGLYSRLGFERVRGYIDYTKVVAL